MRTVSLISCTTTRASSTAPRAFLLASNNTMCMAFIDSHNEYNCPQASCSCIDAENPTSKSINIFRQAVFISAAREAARGTLGLLAARKVWRTVSSMLLPRRCASRRKVLPLPDADLILLVHQALLSLAKLHASASAKSRTSLATSLIGRTSRPSRSESL